jgi:hypothetical protein
VRGDLESVEGVVLKRTARRRPRPTLVLIAALVPVVMSTAVCVGAVLAPAPAAAVPPVVAICVGCPLFAAWELPAAVTSLRADRAARAGGAALANFGTASSSSLRPSTRSVSELSALIT